MAAAGTDAHLVQVFSDHREHSYLSDPTYVALFDALVRWAEDGDKPTPAGIADRCRRFEPQFGQGCRIVPDYRPAPLSARVAPRH